ncbi:hypothetical protein HPP92_019466 [Vanilla planifolia]|uniref:SIAH-type domain-containing protein n=1 Tax=Vanilla planifolia TaxID=51239 RepID=A0A835PDA9_VANPL|nr:hypothetical protein HPP92_027372 [Vanilla planifolia]KAG0465302.1 hypothetical protein HPP92_019466 [Vanilla planifolia]
MEIDADGVDVKRPPLSKKRKNGEEEMLTVKIDPTLLHCTICGSHHPFEDGTIFQCPAGHLLCPTCARRFADAGCPDCLAGAVTRCVALEHFTDAIHTPCPFSEHGCPAFVSRAERSVHAARCPYAPLRCLLPGCKWTGAETLVVDHVRADHPRSCASQAFAYSKAFAVRMGKGEALRLLCGRDGAVFALLVKETDDGGSMMRVLCVRRGDGARWAGSEYEYEVEVRRGRSSVRLRSVPVEWKECTGEAAEDTGEFLFVPREFGGGGSVDPEVELRIRRR